MKRHAITFKQFIRRLYALGAGAPFIPKECGAAFMLFRFHGDDVYFGRAGGPSCPFTNRDDDALVTVREIESALSHLQIESSMFWIGLPPEIDPAQRFVSKDAALVDASGKLTSR